MQPALLMLKDGRRFEAQAIGATGLSVGEVVFNTSMTGYQEITTDPSYAGQIVTFTYPLLGNYGTNREDTESRQAFLAGVVIREDESTPSNFRAETALDHYLKQNNVVGITGVDTRAVTKHIRQYGVIPGAIVSGEALDLSEEEVMARINAFTDQGLIEQVSVKEAYDYGSNQFSVDSSQKSRSSLKAVKNSVTLSPSKGDADGAMLRQAQHDSQPRIAALDFGIKTNILRKMQEMGFEVRVFPHDVRAQDVIDFQPDGLFLSNGPGDPKSIPGSIATIAELIQYYPTMGICLGHQLIALALGGDTYKLKFGHRGANHPVKDLNTGKVTITTQNHGFAVDPESLAGTGLEVTHINLNDQTVEGMRHERLPVFCVQYHPEASAGPQDSFYLFDDFLKLVSSHA